MFEDSSVCLTRAVVTNCRIIAQSELARTYQCRKISGCFLSTMKAVSPNSTIFDRAINHPQNAANSTSH